jgi:hypothetical protein
MYVHAILQQVARFGGKPCRLSVLELHPGCRVHEPPAVCGHARMIYLGYDYASHLGNLPDLPHRRSIELTSSAVPRVATARACPLPVCCVD